MVDLGDVQVDLGGHRILRDGDVLPVKPKAFELLAFLIRHPGQAFTRDQLLEKVWGYDYAGETRTVAVHVLWLRSQIEPDPGHPAFIRPWRGYLFRRPAGAHAAGNRSGDDTLTRDATSYVARSLGGISPLAVRGDLQQGRTAAARDRQLQPPRAPPDGGNLIQLAPGERCWRGTLASSDLVMGPR
jgi:DNA-binding winged helix-turn-helix (wHTH) protein